jgi:alkanesulfonate monooxygenase SsuD/methylene tetrahydromethanopterin reductase-like flavin-dependent oxidoreductase (luciferase family)
VVTRPLTFGVNVDPVTEQLELAGRLALIADRDGWDYVAVQDHPYVDRFVDTWTLITHLAATTRRVRFVTDVASLPLRPPAMLAKAAATLDRLSGGRLDLGLGAGAFQDGIRAMGGPVRRPAEAVDALAEAIEVIRLMWSDRRSVRFDGRHYRLEGLHPGPEPGRSIEIWLGAMGRRMLELTGRSADGWIVSTSYVPSSRLPEMHARIDDAAAATGRSPSAIRRAYNVMGRLGGTQEDDKTLQGPAEKWVDTLVTWATEGRMDTFIIWPTTEPEDQVRRIAAEVIPAVREALAPAGEHDHAS